MAGAVPDAGRFPLSVGSHDSALAVDVCRSGDCELLDQGRAVLRDIHAATLDAAPLPLRSADATRLARTLSDLGDQRAGNGVRVGPSRRLTLMATKVLQRRE